MIPLRLVIDTNIVVSAALKPDGPQRAVFLSAITKPSKLCVTETIVAEYREVLARPELNIRKGLRQQLLQLIKRHARLVVPARRLEWHLTRTTTDFSSAPTLRAPTTS